MRFKRIRKLDGGDLQPGLTVKTEEEAQKNTRDSESDIFVYVYWGLGKLQHGTAEEVIVMGQSARCKGNVKCEETG